MREGEAAWRRIVATAVQSGVPVPGFSSALAYYDSLASERLPASLIQGAARLLRRAHLRAVDRDGTFHTLWSDDRSEVRTDE